ncbi:hypothetical protein SAMN04488542_11677 [Fontibacillus panacisegetis]|uniref:Uncharacterized protein n=2 Tax=Fontibacillus TaxID=995014 RepID=A0A1G7NPE9_9BACL|nr:hypothetical protein SAMN04488542_11677 [Fontibacillus panacisegetis]
MIIRVMTMSYRPSIDNVTKAASNDKDGLYEFIVKLVDGTECRVFYHRFPEWRLTNISRLQKTPCPVCRKDFICKCMDSFTGEFERQMSDEQWFDKALAE